MVRLPKDFVADDLKEVGVWEKVQQSGKSLCQFDALFLISWDQSWAAEAIVSQAAARTATLAGVRIVQTPRRAKALFGATTWHYTGLPLCRAVWQSLIDASLGGSGAKPRAGGNAESRIHRCDPSVS